MIPSRTHAVRLTRSQIDNAALMSLAQAIRTQPQKYTLREKEIVTRGQEFFQDCNRNSSAYKTLRSPDPGVVIRAMHARGDSVATGVATTVIDADVATCLAHEFTKDSRAATAKRKSNRTVNVALRKLNDHSHLYLTVRNLGIRGLFDREFRVRGVWQLYTDGAAILVYEDTTDLDQEYPPKAGNVVASIQTACFFKPLSSVHGIPQTKVTFVARADLKGFISAIFSNPLAGKVFSNLPELRRRFSQGHRIDAANRLVICKNIKTRNTYRATDLGSSWLDEMKAKVRDDDRIETRKIKLKNYLFGCCDKASCFSPIREQLTMHSLPAHLMTVPATI